MAVLNNLMAGFQAIADWYVFLGIVGGIFFGYFVGAMPGLSAAAGMALLVPVTYSMPPVVAISMLVSIYAAAEYGSCVTAITINTPGTPGAIAVCFDGYPFTQRGEPGKALGISIIASVIGAYFSYIFLIAFTEPIAGFAITLGSPEYTVIGLFAMTIVASLIGTHWVKGLVCALAGLLIATVGVDPLDGTPRFTFGEDFLLEGIGFVPILIGICAISEALYLLDKPLDLRAQRRTMSGKLPTWKEITSLKATYLRGSVIGTLVGIVPGAGAAISSLISYNEERRASKHPEKFGTGILEGVAAPEAANNATVGGSLIPLLSLGIPGSNATAVLIGALTMQGIIPGPMLMSRHSDLVYAVFAALLVGALIMLITGLLLTQVWTKILRVPEGILAPVILSFAVVGAYAYSNSFGDVVVALVFGVLGFLMRKNGYAYAPFILAIVLGEMIEINFRRSLMMSHGSYDIFVTRPYSATILLLTVLAVAYPFFRRYRQKRKQTKKADTE